MILYILKEESKIKREYFAIKLNDSYSLLNLNAYFQSNRANLKCQNLLKSARLKSCYIIIQTRVL